MLSTNLEITSRTCCLFGRSTRLFHAVGQFYQPYPTTAFKQFILLLQMTLLLPIPFQFESGLLGKVDVVEMFRLHVPCQVPGHNDGPLRLLFGMALVVSIKIA